MVDSIKINNVEYNPAMLTNEIASFSTNTIEEWIVKFEKTINIIDEGLRVAGGALNTESFPIGIKFGGRDYYAYNVVGGAQEHNIESANTGTVIAGLLPILTELKKELTKRQSQVFTYNYSSIYGTFTTTAETEAKAYAKFQDWLKQQATPEPPIVTPPIVTPPIVTPPIVTPPIVTPPIVTPPIVTPPVVTPEPIVTPPTVDDSISTNMVTQQVINFNIVNGRAVGSIKFVATNNFNPYYYNKEIINLVSFKTPNGMTLLVKENRLRFTATERDEIISYNESIQENTRITVESFVWEWIDKPTGAFSNKYEIKISEAEPPKPVSSGFMGAGIAGAIAGLVLIGFIVDSKGGK